jgi:hypothetical protein
VINERGAYLEIGTKNRLIRKDQILYMIFDEISPHAPARLQILVESQCCQVDLNDKQKDVHTWFQSLRDDPEYLILAATTPGRIYAIRLSAISVVWRFDEHLLIAVNGHELRCPVTEVDAVWGRLALTRSPT